MKDATGFTLYEAMFDVCRTPRTLQKLLCGAHLLQDHGLQNVHPNCMIDSWYHVRTPVGGGVYTREMGTICPFGVFSPCFIVCFASKLAISPLKRSVLGA